MRSVNELGIDSGNRSRMDEADGIGVVGVGDVGKRVSVFVSVVTGLCLLGGALQLGGCAAEAVIKPWQRGKLARPDMQGTPDKLGGLLRDHAYFSKEGTSGSASAGGGGCGCN